MNDTSLDTPAVKALIQAAVVEDCPDGDISSLAMGLSTQPACVALVSRQPGVLAGAALADMVLSAYSPDLAIAWSEGVGDGMRLSEPGVELALIRGPIGEVLRAERILLNFLQRLSGIATITRAFVDETSGTSAGIYDTRKTTPGWRDLERYAVRCGGGRNHRLNLSDAILIKDNHLQGIPTSRLAQAIFDMLNRVSSEGLRPAFVEIEADTLEQVESIFKVVGVDVVLLDNFTTAQMRSAVELRDDLGLGGKIALEASGNVRLERVREIAETGVDRISVGALTHSAPALDLGLDRRE